MITHLRRLIPALAIPLLLLSAHLAQAASVTVIVSYKDEDDTYAVENVKHNSVRLPIKASRALILDANWSGTDEKGEKELSINLLDPALILPGTANQNTLTNSGPLSVFSVTLPLTTGKRQLIYRFPGYSLWIQIDDDKK